MRFVSYIWLDSRPVPLFSGFFMKEALLSYGYRLYGSPEIFKQASEHFPFPADQLNLLSCVHGPTKPNLALK